MESTTSKKKVRKPTKPPVKKVEKPVTENAANIANDASKEAAYTPQVTPEIKPQIPVIDKTITADEVSAGLGNIEHQAASSAAQKAEKIKSVFPEGVFEETKQEAAKTAIEASTGQAVKTNLPAKDEEDGMTWTEAIDFFGSFVLALVLKSDDWDEFCMSEGELAYFNKMEKRCGLVLNINSKWFFFIAIAMSYGIKIRGYLKNKKEEKAALKEKEEKAANKATDTKLKKE